MSERWVTTYVPITVVWWQAFADSAGVFYVQHWQTTVPTPYVYEHPSYTARRLDGGGESE